MTKETEEPPQKNTDNADQTVSTHTDISQTNCEKNVKVESNVSINANEANTKCESETSGNSGSDVKRNLDNSVQKTSGVISGTKTENDNKITEEIEEEDVPGDFFDDFLKEDFMLGLDIVDDDAWEKELEVEASKKVPVVNLVDTKKRKEKKKPKPSSRTDHTEKTNSSLSGEKRHKQKRKRQDDQKKANDKDKHTRGKDKVIDADEFDIRRDPEKTKRAIEQYKVKCEKDKEKKIISEKLSLVETGLVPPGMEMEIDIEEVKRQKNRIEVGSRVEVKSDRNQPPRDLRERLRRLRSKSKSPNAQWTPKVTSAIRRSAIRLRSKSKSPNRRQWSPKGTSGIRRSASPLRKSSPKKRRTRSPGKSTSRRSPARVSPSNKSAHKRSPLTLQRSPLRVRRSPLPFRSPSHRSRGRSFERKSPLRRSRSHSPYYRGRRSRYSPFSRHRDRSDSRESEREKWLRRRRTRSRSPRRKREEKKSFLQEIAEKLNETRPHPVNIMPPLQPQMHYVHPQSLPPIPSPVPAPTPVPPPSNPQFFPSRPQPQPQQQYDPYDQNFFIGTTQPVAPTNFVGRQNNPSVVVYPQQKIPINPQQKIPMNPQPKVPLNPQGKIPLNPLSNKPANSPQLQNSSSSAGSNMSRNMDHPVSAPQPQGQVNIGVIGKKEDLAKLFQDKKITLSEFLAITAKPEVISSSPANLQEKIKVIQRCHEAIKILGSAEKKYTGKLVVQRTDSYQVLEKANLSPLLRNPDVKFPFTQRQTGDEQKVSFTSFINQLLKKIGIMKEAIVVVDNEVPSNAGIQPAPQALAAPPPPTITQNRNVVPNDMRSNRSNKLTSNQLSKLIQTDVFKCEDCERRKRILHKTSAVQCGGVSASFSVSTQVTEDDFYKFQKTQSLASLTPAQLLGKARMGDKDGFDKIPPQSNYPNRMNFMHASEPGYNLPRYRSPSPPLLHFNQLSREEVLPSMYNTNSLRVPFIGGGGGRGRDIPPNPPRTLDPNNRFGYNYY